MGGSTAGSRLPCLHLLGQAGSEAAFTAFVASAGLGPGSEAAFSFTAFVLALRHSAEGTSLAFGAVVRLRDT